MAEEKVLKELELGIRELFRIFIPGAYAVTLIQLLRPDAELSHLIAAKTTSGLLAAFFLGLIGYALRVHERWFPYYFQFEKYRVVLKNEIDRVISSATPKDDNVDIYKYFLSTCADDVNDRIHYFTSFYYMLVELSLFSGAAAFFILATWLRTSISESNPTASLVGTIAIGIAIVAQVGVQCGLRSIKTKPSRIVVYVELALAFGGLVAMFAAACWSGRKSFHDLGTVGWSVLLLSLVGYLFWRLGDKHWEQIVKEQVVLVNVKAQSLIDVSKKFEPAAKV